MCTSTTSGSGRPPCDFEDQDDIDRLVSELVDDAYELPLSLPPRTSASKSSTALINNPVVILADEPTGNLDTTTSHSIMALLTDLNKKGITVVIVTHEEDIAAYTQKDHPW